MGRVLIIDDHPDQCRPLARLVQFAGHNAECSPGGREALVSIHDDRPDLVVCDVMMPDMDGAEVLRRLKADDATRQIPVVMYTAVTDDAYTQFLRDLGAEEVWFKARMGFDLIQAKVLVYLSAADDTLQ